MTSKCTYKIPGSDDECGVKVVYGNRCIRHINQVCVICHEDVSTRNTFSTRRLNCGHAYHTKCLMNWIATDGAQPICPTCREDISDMDIVVFKNKVEDNIRDKYKDAIDSYEQEIARLRETIELIHKAFSARR